MKWIFELTANMGASSELSRHRWIDCNHDSLLVNHDGVAFLDLFVHPLLEVLTDDGRANVDYPLLWNLLQIRLIWQVILDCRLAHDEVEDLLKREILVLRHVHRLDVCVMQVLLLPRNDVFQEVNGHVIYINEKICERSNGCVTISESDLP